MSETTERSYYLVESMYFEKLLRTHFMLTGKHGKIDPVGTDEIDPVKTA